MITIDYTLNRNIIRSIAIIIGLVDEWSYMSSADVDRYLTKEAASLILLTVYSKLIEESKYRNTHVLL